MIEIIVTLIGLLENDLGCDLMGLSLTHFIKYSKWGSERIKAGEIREDQYFSGACLVRSVRDIKEKEQLAILEHHFFEQTDWRNQLTELKESGAVAVAYMEGQSPKKAISQLVELCEQSGLPLLELPADLNVHELSLQCEHLFYIDESQAITTDEMRNILRQAINKDKLNGLLQVLHQWLKCQTVISIKHDIYAYPKIVDYGEANINPCYWRRLPHSNSLPWLESFFIPHNNSYSIRCQIMYNGTPLGALTLNRKGSPFNSKELKVADYAAVLCSGLDHSFAKSTRIQNLLVDAYAGVSIEGKDLELLAERGYAMVLNEREESLPQIDAKSEKNNFLGYLIHTNFGDETYFSFLENNKLVIFCFTDNIKVYTEEMIALLQKNKRFFQVGVSQCYPREKLNTAFAEAKHASQVGKYLDSKRDLFFFHDMGIYRFFNYPDYGWTINQVLDEMTTKLDTLDQDKKRMFTRTLTCLVENNFNYTKTSEELYVHPNTVRYRIGQLEDLWGIDLSKDENKLLFSVIGKLLPLWKHYTGRV